MADWRRVEGIAGALGIGALIGCSIGAVWAMVAWLFRAHPLLGAAVSLGTLTIGPWIVWAVAHVFARRSERD